MTATRLDALDVNLKEVPPGDGLRFGDVRRTAARICGLVPGEYAHLPAPQRTIPACGRHCSNKHYRYLLEMASAVRAWFLSVRPLSRRQNSLKSTSMM